MRPCSAIHLLILTLLFSLLVAPACTRLAPTRPPEQPAALPVPEVIDRLAARRQQITSFTAKGRVTVLTPQRKYNGSAFIAALKPATLRVDVLNFFGQPVVTFFTDGQEVKLLAYTEGKLYRGPATPQHLGFFIPPPVTVPELIDFMSGTVPFDPERQAHTALTADGNDLRLDFTAPDTQDRISLWLDPQGLEIRRARWLDDQNRPLYQVDFQDYTAQGDLSHPQQVNLASDATGSRIKLHFQTFSPNPPQIGSQLLLPDAAGLQEVPLPQ